MPTTQFRHPGEGGGGGDGVQSLKFPSSSTPVCAYEEDCAACAVYVEAKDCVCVQWRRWRASSSSPPPVAQTPPAAIAPSGGGGGAVPCAGSFAGPNQGKARAQKEMVVFAKIFRQKSTWLLVVLCCFEYLLCNKNCHQHLIIDISLTCVDSGARWGGLCYSILVEEHW